MSINYRNKFFRVLVIPVVPNKKRLTPQKAKGIIMQAPIDANSGIISVGNTKGIILEAFEQNKDRAYKTFCQLFQPNDPRILTCRHIIKPFEGFSNDYKGLPCVFDNTNCNFLPHYLPKDDFGQNQIIDTSTEEGLLLLEDAIYFYYFAGYSESFKEKRQIIKKTIDNRVRGRARWRISFEEIWKNQNG